MERGRDWEVEAGDGAGRGVLKGEPGDGAEEAWEKGLERKQGGGWGRRSREELLGEAKGRKGSVRVQGGKVRPPGSKRVGADRPKPLSLDAEGESAWRKRGEGSEAGGRPFLVVSQDIRNFSNILD